MIQGAGPGLLATAVAAVAGAKRIVVVGAPEARLALARDFGATDTISIEAMPSPPSGSRRCAP